jgi:hypothetical protein
MLEVDCKRHQCDHLLTDKVERSFVLHLYEGEESPGLENTYGKVPGVWVKVRRSR